MIPIRDNLISRHTPYLTYTLVALNVAIFLWDRGGSFSGQGTTFADLAMRPDQVVDAVRHFSGDAAPLVTLFTSLFLHGNLTHLIGNMIFLIVFGTNVEHALGGIRFALYYLAWGVVAGVAQIFVDPGSNIPVIGASGAVGGILGCYLLLFPGNKITFFVFPFFFFQFVISAWIMLGVWFLWQIFFPQENVANWAHAGGFLAGMLTVLVMGGREKVLKSVDLEHDPEAEYA